MPSFFIVFLVFWILLNLRRGGERGGAEGKRGEMGGDSEKIWIKSTDLCQENAGVTLREDRSSCSTMLKCKKYQNKEERKVSND